MILASSSARSRHRPHPLGAGALQRCGRLAKGSSRCFYIINKDNCLAHNPIRLGNRKNACHIQPPRLAREFNLRGRPANSAERTGCNLAAKHTAQLPSKKFGLIESAHALPRRMQRNGNEHALGRQGQAEALE